MRSKWSRLVAPVLAWTIGTAVLSTGTAQAQRPSPKKSGWFTDLTAAKAEAKSSGKPMLVAFRCEP